MATQPDCPTAIPLSNSERTNDDGLTTGPPLRERLLSSSQKPPGDLYTTTSSAEISLKENREIMTYIFRYLTNQGDLFTILLVCRAWSGWGARILWHKPDLKKVSSLQKILCTLDSEYEMNKMLQNRLSGPTTYYTYSKFIRRLNLFHLGSASVSYSMLTTFSRCELLERVVLIRWNTLKSPVLEARLSSWPNLVSIDLTDVSGLTNQAIISLTQTSRRVLGINVTNCNRLGDPSLIAISQNCPEIRRLKMGKCHLVTDVGVSAVVKGCPMLVELDVHGCLKIMNGAVRAVWTHSLRMRELRLASCDALTDLAFPLHFAVDSEGEGEEVPPANKTVVADTDPPQSGKEVVTTDPREPVSDPLPGLTSIELSPLIIHWALIGMRTLDLSSCSQITDAAIEGIIAHAPGIRSLFLARCSLLTDRSVKAICKLGRSLSQLDLSHAAQITDEGVKQLARMCNRLRYVGLGSCGNLTDASVIALSIHLRKLRRIGFVRVPELTDTAVYTLIQRSATLERLHLSYCTHISVEAIHSLLARAHRLTHLSLTGVPSFLNHSLKLQSFCRAVPPDYNSSQRAVFCVYSGEGIWQLRRRLDGLFPGRNFDELEIANAIGDAAPVEDDSTSDSDHSVLAM